METAPESFDSSLFDNSNNNNFAPPPPPPHPDDEEQEDMPPPPVDASDFKNIKNMKQEVNGDSFEQFHSGYLVKLPRSYKSSSAIRKLALKGRKRFFVLNRNSLEYFESHEDQKEAPKGKIPLDKNIRITLDSSSTSRGFTISFLETNPKSRASASSVSSSGTAVEEESKDEIEEEETKEEKGTIQLLYVQATNEADRFKWVNSILNVLEPEVRALSADALTHVQEESQGSADDEAEYDSDKDDDEEEQEQEQEQEEQEEERRERPLSMAQVRVRANSDLAAVRDLPSDSSERQVRKKGYLFKKGGSDGGRNNWRKRFFVLTDNLSYLKTESDLDILLADDNYYDADLTVDSNLDNADDDASTINRSVSNASSRSKRLSTASIVGASASVAAGLPWSKTIALETFSIVKHEAGDGRLSLQQSKLGFDVCTNTRTLSCRAETEEERDEWVDELRRPLKEDESNNFLQCLYGRDEEMARLTTAIRNSYSAPVQQKERMKSHRATKLL